MHALAHALWYHANANTPFIVRNANRCGQKVSDNYIHTAAALLLYGLLRHFSSISREAAIVMALLVWFALQVGKYMLLRRYYPSFLYARAPGAS